MAGAEPRHGEPGRQQPRAGMGQQGGGLAAARDWGRFPVPGLCPGLSEKPARLLAGVEQLG